MDKLKACNKWFILHQVNAAADDDNTSIGTADHEGLPDCEMLSMPHCLDNLLRDGGDISGFTHLMCSTLQKHFALFLVLICYRLSKQIQCLVREEGLWQLNNSGT
jgi:hypothetical protein